jgi:hypothetical protein
MKWSPADVARVVAAKTGTWLEIVKSLPFDGGPSVTRWVFLRTAEAISIGWLCLVGALIYRVARYGDANPALCGLIFTLAGALFGFAALNQNTKLTVDAKSTGSPSTITTTGGKVETGTENKSNDDGTQSNSGTS